MLRELPWTFPFSLPDQIREICFRCIAVQPRSTVFAGEEREAYFTLLNHLFAFAPAHDGPSLPPLRCACDPCITRERDNSASHHGPEMSSFSLFILTTLAMRFGAQTYNAGKTEISTHTDLTTVGRQPQIYKSLDFFFFIM